MDLNTVIKNLENTIEGKEEFYQSLTPPNLIHKDFNSELATMSVLKQFLRMNIDELKLILNDLKSITYFQGIS